MLNKLADMYFVLLILSVFLFALKIPVLNVSPYYIFLVPYFCLGVVFVFSGFYLNSLDKVDFLFFSLVFFNLLYAVFDSGYQIDFIVYKTLFLFVSYMGIRRYLTCVGDVRLYGLFGFLSKVLTLVLVGFVFFVFYLYFVLDLTSFNYHSATMPIVKEIYAYVIGDAPDDFSSKMIMRNTYGEIFVLLGFFVLLDGYIRSKRVGFLRLFVSLFSVYFTFSRRAMIEVSVVVISFMAKGRNLSLYFYLLAFVLFSLILVKFLFFADVSVTRQIDFSDPARFGMISAAIPNDFNQFLFGRGYGYQYEGKYIHNFVLSHFYMFGMVGLLLSMLFYFFILYRLLKAISFDNPLVIILIIPCVGMMVGSTFEGLLTPAGYLALAIGLRASDVERRSFC